MIQIEKQYWGDISVLVIYPVQFEEKPLPVVTYFHGFTSAKEDNLTIAYMLAEKGYRVILPDAYLHGERSSGDGSVELQLHFFEIIQRNLLDLTMIKSRVEENNWVSEGRFGIAGTSMGGITTAAALAKYDWIKAGAILMGTPKLTAFAELLIGDAKRKGYLHAVTDEKLNEQLVQLELVDLSRHFNRLGDRPLFMWHGEADQVVPFQHTYEFYQEVSNNSIESDRIHFVSEKNVGHKVSRRARLETVNWFHKYL